MSGMAVASLDCRAVSAAPASCSVLRSRRAASAMRPSAAGDASTVQSAPYFSWPTRQGRTRGRAGGVPTSAGHTCRHRAPGNAPAAKRSLRRPAPAGRSRRPGLPGPARAALASSPPSWSGSWPPRPTGGPRLNARCDAAPRCARRSARADGGSSAPRPARTLFDQRGGRVTAVGGARLGGRTTAAAGAAAREKSGARGGGAPRPASRPATTHLLQDGP